MPQSKKPLKNRSILVVDDCLDMLTLGRYILENDGFEVFTASSGAEALEVLSHMNGPDLLLLDMQMPDMDGHQFLTRLEDEKPKVFNDVPIVFYSGENQILPSKAKGFIPKSGDINLFLKSVNSFI